MHSAKIEFQNYSKAIIVSGDGDFYCLIEELIKDNKLYYLFIPNSKSQSSLLKEFSQYKVFLEKSKAILKR